MPTHVLGRPRSRGARRGAVALSACLAVAAPFAAASPVAADAHNPSVIDPKLGVHKALGQLSLPIGMAFLPDRSALVIEKVTGQVKHVTFTSNSGLPNQTGKVTAVALDLAVNGAGERGLLGITVDPKFSTNGLVYLYWTESTTGADTTVPTETPLLGNRVDAYRWDPRSRRLSPAHNVILLRALQQDGTTTRTNHNGGVIEFGPDGKLYVVVGDVGRRGQMQNLANGPGSPDDANEICTSAGLPATCDDQFGGPEPDNAHLTGVVLRLNPDGSAPTDNPFYSTGAEWGGEVGGNIQKIYAYGVRNSFGLDFDPFTGDPWMSENGEDTFDEINHLRPGHNGGWIQIMGPRHKYAEYRELETGQNAAYPGYLRHQQARWAPSNLAPDAASALDRLFMLPKAHYSDPELAWKHQVPPAAIAFTEGRSLGPEYAGDLVVGAARTSLQGGHLFRLEIDAEREGIVVTDPALDDRVADNAARHDPTESETLLWGSNFGVVPDLVTAPDGSLYAVSLTNGALYQIHRRVGS